MSARYPHLPPGDRPTRREIYAARLRSFTKRELADALDYWCRRATVAEQTNDPNGAEFADGRYEMVSAELDRRNAAREERQRRKFARDLANARAGR